MNIVIFDGVINDQSNLQDIDLIKILQWYHHGPNFIFLDDNTIPHNTHIIIISDVDIPLIEWPAMLSNSIEQLWDMLEPCLYSWSLNTLLQKQHVPLGWGLEYHAIKKNTSWLVRRMSQTYQAMIHANGGNAHFWHHVLKFWLKPLQWGLIRK